MIHGLLNEMPTRSRIAVHWPRFGPYHLARLGKSQEFFNRIGMEVIGLEIAGDDKTYAWRREKDISGFRRVTAFPGRSYGEIGLRELLQACIQALDEIRPSAVAINGYSSKDALVLLSWCSLRRIPAILMSDSKHDDAPRRGQVEWVKSRIVGRYSGALCAGTLHKEYLMRLGMPAEKIFLGYDAIDTEYFAREANRIRQAQQRGEIESNLALAPFFLASARFIDRKNLDTLVNAYALYRMKAASLSMPTWKLVILGDGELRSRLEAQIKRSAVVGVSLPGFKQIDELPRYYGLAGAFIHPALQDQWGLVVNEAMASGLPVMVSGVCGCAPDLVIENITGCTFDPRDAEGLSALMLNWSSRPEMVREMGENAQAHIQGWGLELFADGLLKAYMKATHDS